AVPEDHTWVNCMAMLAEECCAIGDRDRADVLYNFLLPYARCNVVAQPYVPCYGVIARHLGMLASTTNRWEDSARRVEVALELNTRQGGRPWVAHSQHAYAAMLLARKNPGDLERARALSADAVTTARALGMRALIERAEALSARLEGEAFTHASQTRVANGYAWPRTSGTSMTASAGRWARRAASRIASALGASYRQKVFFLSALRNEKSQLTPTSSFTCFTAARPCAVIWSCSAKVRSIMNSGIRPPSAARPAIVRCTLSCADSIRR